MGKGMRWFARGSVVFAAGAARRAEQVSERLGFTRAG